MLPFISSQSLGHDYQTIGIQSQMELFFSIKTGSFPLYVPGFAFGRPSSTLTLGQLYHPISYIASALPGYWNGKALEWMTFLRLITLGLTHFALFAFLQRLKINRLFSFLLSFITIYNLRMLDLFRYGASLESYTGFLLLCTAIGFYFIEPAKRLIQLSIIGATYWLICSGHAQMMYYGMLGAGLFTLVAPFFIATMVHGKSPDISSASRFWLRTYVLMLLGILLSSAYILPFYFDNLATLAERVGQNYEWSLAYGDTFIGTVNSFFLPFRSDIHGNFGGSALFIITFMFPFLRFLKVKPPRSVWVIWSLLLVCFLYMQGDRTAVHRLAWEYLPFASSFRAPGRISIIMPLFMMLLLAWLVRAEQLTFVIKGRAFSITPLAALTGTALAAAAVFYIFSAISFSYDISIMKDTAHFTPVTIREIPLIAEAVMVLAGIASLITLIMYAGSSEKQGLKGCLLCIIVLIHTGCALKYGTWVVQRQDKPSFEQMLSDKTNSLSYRHHAGYGVYSSTADLQIRHAFMEPFLGKIYFDIIPVHGQEDAYDRMQKDHSPQRLYIEDHRAELPAAAPSPEGEEKSDLALIYSSFNRLQFKVHSSSPAFFGLSYPYSGHWSAEVNGNKADVYRANGAAQAVPIPEGDSIVEFRYWSSAAFWGMVISTASFILIGLYFCLRLSDGIKSGAAMFCVLFLGAAIFYLWYHSLYSGTNLNTAYSWAYTPSSSNPNIAYGKKTSVSAPLTGGFFHPRHSSRAIDGNTAPDSGFSTATHKNPFIEIDLSAVKTIKTIVLHESIQDPSVNIRPLQILLSTNGKTWHTVAEHRSANDKGPIRIILEPNQAARYVRVKATGTCRIALDEVEMYGSLKTL